MSIILTLAVHNGYSATKVLIFTKNGKGYVHENIAASVECLKKICVSLKIQCDVSDKSDVFTTENLKQYKTIIFSNTNNEVFDTEDQKAAFQKFIQNGGGFVGIHSAIGTERNWEWFKQMIGGTFLSHPPFQKYTLRKFDKKHTANTNLPDSWEKEDECYYAKEINPGIHVLWVADLTTLNDPNKPNVFGNQFPAIWCNEFDGGRQWYTALGHAPSDYSNELYIKHLTNGIKWTLKK